MKVYVIRHGRTKCNNEEKYNGKLDEDINEIGIRQAIFILMNYQEMVL